MDIHTDFPERLKPGLKVFVGPKYNPMVIASRRGHAAGLLVRMRGVKTPEQAGVYRNLWVFVPTADRPTLPDGEYYHHQLLGLEVHSDGGQILGTLIEVLETGANDVYVISDVQGKELLLPAIPEVILEVDLEQGRMLVHLMEGLV